MNEEQLYQNYRKEVDEANKRLEKTLKTHRSFLFKVYKEQLNKAYSRYIYQKGKIG